MKATSPTPRTFLALARLQTNAASRPGGEIEASKASATPGRLFDLVQSIRSGRLTFLILVDNDRTGRPRFSRQYHTVLGQTPRRMATSLIEKANRFETRDDCGGTFSLWVKVGTRQRGISRKGGTSIRQKYGTLLFARRRGAIARK